jgi:hypothetical protein
MRTRYAVNMDMSLKKRLRSGLAAAAVASICLPAVSSAYTRETHYYLRFALSLATCFDWDEAHLIASGDWMMDGNLSTHAEPTPFQKRNKVGFHAFGHSDLRFNELWDRTRAEPDLELRLIKLGQFMHFLEDWESHAGFGIALGHARATFSGRDPDSLGHQTAKNHRMVQSALEHLLRTCTDIGRAGDPSMPTDSDYYLVWLMRLILRDGLMDDLYEIGDPSWKRGRIKGIRRAHQVTRDQTIARIELFVEALKAYPAKRIPDWFEPGHAEYGIPPVLEIPYNRRGDILATPGAVDPVAEILARNRADRHEEDVRVFIESYGEFGGGFTVQLRVANVGSEASGVGSVDAYVIDPAQETELGRASLDLQSLAPGERVEKRLTIRARTTSGQRVMIAALARVKDFSAYNNEAWLMSMGVAGEDPEVPLIVDVDPDLPGQERVAIARDPKFWLIDDEAVCVLLTATTSEGDATEKLIAPRLEVLAEDGTSMFETEAFPSKWGASALSGSPIIAAKTYACFSLRNDSCDQLAARDDEAVSVQVAVKASDLEPAVAVYPLPKEIMEGVQRFCTPPM